MVEGGLGPTFKSVVHLRFKCQRLSLAFTHYLFVFAEAVRMEWSHGDFSLTAAGESQTLGLYVMSQLLK